MSHHPHTAEPTHTADCTPAWRKMLARSPNESHRVASTLELLFDLVFVVAISAAAGQ